MIFSPKQTDFLKSELHEINACVGVTMSGKSFINNLKWYDMICSAPPKSLFLQSGNTSGSLYNNITAELFKIDDKIGWLEEKNIDGGKRIIVKPTGTNVMCLGADDQGAYTRIRGNNLSGWYADEVTKQPRTFVQQALACCRTVKNGKIAITPALWTLNPDTPLHYLKREYLDNLDIDIKSWIFGFHDNPLLGNDIIERLKKKFTGVFYQRMILGLWSIAQGCIYDTFKPDFHIIHSYPKESIKEWTLGIDWGYEHPMVIGLFGTDEDGIDYLVDSMYFRHQVINSDLKNKIEARGWLEHQLTAYGDPARPDYIQQFQDVTGIDTVPADNDVIEGIQEVQKKFIIGDNGKAGLYILDTNKKIIEELQSYHRKENKDGITLDEPVKENDDGVDMIRYNIYTRRSSFDLSTLGKAEFKPIGESKEWADSLRS